MDFIYIYIEISIDFDRYYLAVKPTVYSIKSLAVFHVTSPAWASIYIYLPLPFMNIVTHGNILMTPRLANQCMYVCTCVSVCSVCRNVLVNMSCKPRPSPHSRPASAPSLDTSWNRIKTSIIFYVSRAPCSWCKLIHSWDHPCLLLDVYALEYRALLKIRNLSFQKV